VDDIDSSQYCVVQIVKYNDMRAEIEALRSLCARMATLLEDCRPADATLMWVMGRLDVIEEWQSRSAS
jgi:hypothetical protein